MTKFPATINFISDGTVAKLVGEIPVSKNNKTRMGQYKFSKAKTNKGLEFTMPLEQIERLHGENLITIK